MGRPRGSKNSKAPSKENGKKKGPESADAKKTRSMDEVLGAKILEVQSAESSEEEGEILSPKSSLIALKKQSEDRNLFSNWLNVINNEAIKNVDHNSTVSVSHPSVMDKTTVDSHIPKNDLNDMGCNTGVCEEIDKNDIPSIEMEDIQDEVLFWRNSTVCYILGASPPQSVMEVFLRRIWVKNRIDRIGRIGNGIFLIRLMNQEDQERILAMDCQFFDGKPVTVRPWKPDVDWSMKKVDRVPIRIELHESGGS